MTEPRIYREAGNDGLDAAEAALAAGGLVVFPTDTVYGLAAHPGVEGGTQALFAAKRRSRELTLPVLVADVERAREVAVLDERAESLAAKYWPGPVTLVLPRTQLSGRWDLGEEGASVGARIPNHAVALSLLRRTGPLVVTSANRSGEPTPPDCDGVRRVLGHAVSVYLCGGRVPRGVASTVVDLTGSDALVIRGGAVPAADVEAALREG